MDLAESRSPIRIIQQNVLPTFHRFRVSVHNSSGVDCKDCDGNGNGHCDGNGLVHCNGEGNGKGNGDGVGGGGIGEDDYSTRSA